MKSIRSVFLTTPQWLPLNPSFSPVPFVSYLKENGYDSRIIDLNIEYYLYVLNKDYLKKSLNKAYEQLPELFKYLSKNFKHGLTPENYNDNFKSLLLKYNKIKEFKTEKAEQINAAIDKVEYSIKVMRNKELFYNPKELTFALNNIDFCLEIASLPYFPALIQMGNYSDPFLKLEFEDMVKNAQQDNMFCEFYKSYLDKILENKPDIIGISINSTTQIVSALTLAMMLKKKKSAKILIGGNFFSRLGDSLKKYPKFFKYFCDYLMLEEGEIPNLKICEYLEDKISIEDVPNLVYCKNNKVIINPICRPLEMEQHVVSDLSDFNLEKYLTPDIVIPQQSSKGCYWGKCSFCDHDFGQKLSIKTPDKFISELMKIKDKYRINHFELIDECISPTYLKKMSDKILENNLEVFWFNNARLEKGFDREIFNLAHRAGLRMLLWGFESASEKIMKLINKGIDVASRLEILKNARCEDIWNFVFIFLAFLQKPKRMQEKQLNL